MKPWVEPIPDNVVWLYSLWIGSDVLCDPQNAVKLADEYLKAYRQRFGEKASGSDNPEAGQPA